VVRIAVSDPERKSKRDLVKRSIWHRESNTAKWEKIFEFDTIAGRVESEGVLPLAFDYDNTTLYVAANFGRDKAAIYKYDTRTKKMGEVMFEHPLVDVTGGLVFHRGQKKLLGIRFEADRPITRWVDDDLHRIQQAVDATFKGTNNQIILPQDSADRALILSSSDVNPGFYHLFDRKANGVEELVKQREWIDPALMSERRFFTYKARDGRDIPAWVTIPRGSSGKNLPLIVNVHGGPAARGFYQESWGRWPDAQFFASRGYAVLETEPRGSTGFGQAHWKAGWKQWGGTAQDDITDGALHLVKEGIADKSRMCIMGGSYGGYASAMAVVKDPDLWRCSAPFVAVTDLTLLQEVTYSDTAQLSDYLDTDFLRVVGDPRADREMFQRASPARHGDKVKAPVFLAMGSRDVRVPEVHGSSFYNAVTKAGGKIEYKVYNGEGHGFNKDANVFDFYRTLEKFFAENLK
jgi:prolyl oligopeptidase PreP (S9A serine peptidase family)